MEGPQRVQERLSNQRAFLEAMEAGRFEMIDGVISPQTKSLVSKLGASGVDMTTLWVATPQNWNCPACGRHKTEIVRLNNKKELMCRLVEHHDHVRDLLLAKFEEVSTSLNEVVADQNAKEFAKRAAAILAAYDNTVICDDCNSADPHAKKLVGADRRFSYSAHEIRRFVIPRPHQSHEINREVAKQIWSENKETFFLRLKVIARIAEIAANNKHWYQPVEFKYQPDIVIQRANSTMSPYGINCDSSYLTGSEKSSLPRDLSAWRYKRHRSQKPPSRTEIEHVAKVSCARLWNLVGDDWACPACNRSKVEIIRPSNQTSWSFPIDSRWFRDPLSPRGMAEYTVCSDCAVTAENMAKEALDKVGLKNVSGYSKLIEIKEIAALVVPKLHARHEFNNIEADKIISNIGYRILGDLDFE